MHKLILFFVITHLSINCLSQGKPDNLDYLNGFRQFKFGEGFQKYSSFIIETTDKEDKDYKSDRIREFTCHDEELAKLGAQFKLMMLYYLDNKLFQIKLWTFVEPEDLVLKKELGIPNDYILVGEELDKLFGKTRLNKQTEDAIARYTIEYWETEKIKLEFNMHYVFALNNKMYMYVLFTDKELAQKAALTEYE